MSRSRPLRRSPQTPKLMSRKTCRCCRNFSRPWTHMDRLTSNNWLTNSWHRSITSSSITTINSRPTFSRIPLIIITIGTTLKASVVTQGTKRVHWAETVTLDTDKISYAHRTSKPQVTLLTLTSRTQRIIQTQPLCRTSSKMSPLNQQTISKTIKWEPLLKKSLLIQEDSNRVCLLLILLAYLIQGCPILRLFNNSRRIRTRISSPEKWSASVAMLTVSSSSNQCHLLSRATSTS